MNGAELRAQLDAALEEVDGEWEPQDFPLLEMISASADDIVRLEEYLDEAGNTVIGSTGQEKLNPVIAELRLQRAALASLLRKLEFPEPESDGEDVRKSSRHAAAANSRWARSADQRARRKRGNFDGSKT